MMTALTEKLCKGYVYIPNHSNKYLDLYGLSLKVRKNNTKCWSLRVHTTKFDKVVTIGEYPVMTLKQARLKAIDTRSEILNGSPKVHSFGQITQEWLLSRKDKIDDKSYRNTVSRLQKYVFPTLTNVSADKITSPMIFMLIKDIANNGKEETARRVFNIVTQILSYAVLIGEIPHNVATDLKGAFASKNQGNHMAAIIDEKQLGLLLRELDKTESTITRCAIQFQAYTLTRPNEVRYAEWSEIDFEKKLWIIPAKKMKMRREHIVPLSAQTLNMLEIMKSVSGDKSRYIFPQLRNFNKPMTENTANIELKNLTDRLLLPHHTSHGFRSTGSTLLNKNGFGADIIEWALAHTPRDRIRSIYNRHEYLEERKVMLQWYADFLDKLRDTV